MRQVIVLTQRLLRVENRSDGCLMKSDPWYYIFNFIRDGISGPELLGLVLVLGILSMITVVQYSESGPAKKIDFVWIFADAKTGKLSRSGLMIFGGFLLGCWAIVDAESNGRLDWSFFGMFLAYCAGVRAIEVFKPKDTPDAPSGSETPPEVVPPQTEAPRRGGKLRRGEKGQVI